MVAVQAVSMVGGTIFHRWVIQREISRALVLNLSGEQRGASAPHRTSLSLTLPSLLSRATREFPFSVQLAFSLQSGEERKGVNFRTRAELESEFIRTPPSLYLLRPEQEPRSQTGESRAKAGIRDMVLEKIDAAIFGIPVQTIRMLLLGIYRFKCG